LPIGRSWPIADRDLLKNITILNGRY